MVVANDDIGMVIFYAVTGYGIVGTDKIVVFAIDQRRIEAIDIVELRRGSITKFRCSIRRPDTISIFRLISLDRIANTHDLSHVGIVHDVAATKGHDLSATGRNSSLQGFAQGFRILQVASDGSHFRDINIPVGVRNDVACPIDKSCIGICRHIGLTDDAVGHAAKGSRIFSIIIDVKSTIRQGRSPTEIHTAWSSCLVNDTRQRTRYRRSNTAGISQIPRCQSPHFLCSVILFISVGSVSSQLICYIRYILYAVILRLRSINSIVHSFELCHIDSIRILRTSCDVGNLTGNFLGRIADGNCSSRRFPGARSIGTVVTLCWVITNDIQYCSRIARSHRTGTKGYTAFDSSIGIIAEDGNVFLIRRQRSRYIS